MPCSCVRRGDKEILTHPPKQKESEYILLLEGFAILEFEDYEVELKRGDCLNIEAMQKHRVKFTSQDELTIWFAVFY